jgi:hypothetical protein
VEAGTNYPGNDLDQSALTAENYEDCCQQCAQVVECVAWTFDENSKKCFLKGQHPRETITKVIDGTGKFTSGMPTQVGRQIYAQHRELSQSLYCFSLVLPWGSEKALLEAQYQEGAGIFGCDEYAAFSSQAIKVAPGVTALVVNHDLQCAKGGEFQTALNTEIFFAVWDKIAEDRRYTLYGWTVKVDPDAVYLPDRLRYALLNHHEYQGGTYLNNCEMGLHGPLEVFSHLAVERWLSGREECKSHFNAKCSGDCKWGEDMFIDQCLEKVLRVTREYDHNLLVEAHCEPPPNWQNCQTNQYVVSFHPFKTPQGYRGCLAQARAMEPAAR